MKLRLKQKGSMYEYLDSSGVLATNDRKAIEACKQEYYREYKKRWRNERRKIEKEFTVGFNPSELKLIIKAAKEYKRSNSRFIKDAVLAYINLRPVPDIEATNEIKQHLIATNEMIRKLLDNQIVPRAVGKYLLVQMNYLEKEIMRRLK